MGQTFKIIIMCKRIIKLYTLEEDYKFQFLSLPRHFRAKLIKKIEGPFRVNNIEINYIGITIPKGYSWDGCSPKFRTKRGQIFGASDGKIVNGKPETYYASLVHDALYSVLEYIPFSRRDVDLIFYFALNDFECKDLYYLMIRLLGGIYHRWNKGRY